MDETDPADSSDWVDEATRYFEAHPDLIAVEWWDWPGHST